MSLFSRIVDIQKLHEAWNKVKKNKPASGVDNVTWEMFEEREKEEVKKLNVELLNHNYEPFPVKLVTLYKNEKKREIALYSMRDKVVQQAIAYELNKMYDGLFSMSTYAYRPNKSALNAIDEIDAAIKKREFKYALKLDISHFFDTISWNILENVLREKISEDEVVELIKKQCTVPALMETGDLVSKNNGIYQGSSLAPILSNVYLKDFDKEVLGQCQFYIRYSDDMLLLSDISSKLEVCLKKISIMLENMGLNLNKDKSMIVQIREGFSFLGYSFNENGKYIPEKAEAGLLERLEEMWLSKESRSIQEKLQKGAEILEGWEQFFREERTIKSIYEYAVVLYMIENKMLNSDVILKQRIGLKNVSKELCCWLAGYWKKRGNIQEACREYEDYYEIYGRKVITMESSNNKYLLELYEKIALHENIDDWTEIMQIYSDRASYEQASLVMDRISALEEKSKVTLIKRIEYHDNKKMDVMQLTKEQIEEYMSYFVGREDAYVSEEILQNGKRVCNQVIQPVTEQLIREHFAGNITIGTYVQRNNATVKFCVIDVDISKKVLLTIRPEQISAYREKAAELTNKIYLQLREIGIKGYIEESGYRGYHIWVLFSEWIPVRYVNMFEDVLEERIEIEGDTFSIEFFPNKSRLKNGFLGQTIKLPCGYHPKTREQSRFLTEDFSETEELGGLLTGMASYNVNAIKKIIASSEGKTEKETEQIQKLDEDLSLLGEIPGNISVVLQKCNLMRYLCLKAKKTGYLTHFERLSILYVFGHMGEEGKVFIHQVMECTLNYQYHITQKFISKVAAKPISCIKLREQYKKITAEYGCNCNFKKLNNCYPSPVLHAIKSGEEVEGITLPTSRTLSKEKKDAVCDELNIGKKVQEITGKILELKRQKRTLDKNITKHEKELERIFDDSGIDSMEVEFGILVRRKKEEGYEWVVEI